MQKGFPLDSDLDSLMAFFEKFGSTELVQMRRDKKKEFKVSFVCKFMYIYVVLTCICKFTCIQFMNVSVDTHVCYSDCMFVRFCNVF